MRKTTLITMENVPKAIAAHMTISTTSTATSCATQTIHAHMKPTSWFAPSLDAGLSVAMLTVTVSAAIAICVPTMLPMMPMETMCVRRTTRAHLMVTTTPTATIFAVTSTAAPTTQRTTPMAMDAVVMSSAAHTMLKTMPTTMTSAAMLMPARMMMRMTQTATPSAVMSTRALMMLRMIPTWMACARPLILVPKIHSTILMVMASVESTQPQRRPHRAGSARLEPHRKRLLQCSPLFCPSPSLFSAIRHLTFV
mmetsp:Transcript_51717/g.76651  ORF Transcript_51717/g.76651 Transcript_51717/m.76651 type:complete len:253 (-) Transcript_51717:104-862(-)